MLLGGALLLQSVDSAAQINPLERRLAAATRVECQFTAVATGDWAGDMGTAAVAETQHEATFFDVDIDGGTAESEGQFGATFIVVRYAHAYLHFMQMSDAGPLHLTTVLAQESSNGRLKAMQTRHEYSRIALPGFTSRPEM